VIVGDGPERRRLGAVTADLGLADIVEVRASVPYDEMPALYAQASCFVLASLPVRFWEEQFGMVLAEAMAGYLPIVASTSGGDSRGPRRQRLLCRARRLGWPCRHPRARTARREARRNARRCHRNASSFFLLPLLLGVCAPSTTSSVEEGRREAMTADVILVTWRSGGRVLRCLERLSSQQPGERTFVVDNASHDGTVEGVRARFPDVHVLELAENRGFGAAVNAGVAAGAGEAIVLVNDDVEVASGFAEQSSPRCARTLAAEWWPR